MEIFERLVGQKMQREDLESCLRSIGLEDAPSLLEAFAGSASEIDVRGFVDWLEPSGEETAWKLYRRGFSVRQLIQFVKKYRGRGLCSMSTAQVVRDIIIPETFERRCAMVELFEGGPQEPSCLMSHWWGHSFMALVEAILGHASGQILPAENVLSEEELQKCYWLCIFGVNQHVSICGTKENPCSCGAPKYLNGHKRCEMDKFGLMMHHFAEHALAVDRHLVTLTRIWVLQELQTALSLQLPTEFLGTVSFEVPLETVRTARASREEDRRMILAEIEETMGIDAFDRSISEKVQSEKAKLGFFDALVRRNVTAVERQLASQPELCNVQLKQFGLKAPLHFMAERTRCAGEWEDLSGRKAILESIFRARADVTLVDASGRTPLHTICMWDGDASLARRLVELRCDPQARGWRGAVRGKTPLELLEEKVCISPQLFDRGFLVRSKRATSELEEYLRSLNP